jgi:hypothetical protein
LAVSVDVFIQCAALDAQETRQSKGTGRIAGKVRLEGSFKRPAPLKVHKNRDFCGAQVPNETLLAARDGSVQNVVVIIRGPRINKSRKPAEPISLDNKKCAFVPHVQAAALGSELLLLNSDPILHDAHARMGQETLFNVGLPSWRQVKKRLTREGVVKIECDALHTWQSAHIVVTSSPYFALTDKNGAFIIEQVPAGRYDLEFWHEKLGRQRRAIVVNGGQTPMAEAVFSCPAC